ncbi:flagellar export chaperone FliS [Periweissella ghanensis]|uniref:Flagellar secretion chaperone FliS n=2 Tax=Periweissella ghanensis TaxID=467997 RepID=A0ABM8ZAM0_9LACO|nr:flagellar export chaperone FliS [Periweissella ghanensis]CAH0417922.1 Flagellar secretion chaperone FliS [Periweissella ghanensis]
MNSYQQTNQNYLKNQVMSASPAQLITMLIAGGIKNVKQAQTAIAVGDVIKTHDKLINAQDIIMELRYSVKEEIDAELSHQLITMYEYMYNQLVLANVNQDVAKIAEVEQLLMDLLTTWKQIETQV